MFDRDKNVCLTAIKTGCLSSFLKSKMDLITQLFQNATTQQNLRVFIKQVGHWVYDEIYLYVWFLCFYNVLLLFLVAASLYLLTQQRNNHKTE